MEQQHWQQALAPFLAQLRAAGSDLQLLIDPASVVTAPWVRFKCRFGCKNYGKMPLCPPNTPDEQEMRRLLAAYSVGILYRVRGKVPAQGLAAPVLRALCAAGYYKAIAFDNAPCAAGEGMGGAPTLEACSVDVVATARGNGIPLELGRSADGAWDCFGLLLVE